MARTAYNAHVQYNAHIPYDGIVSDAHRKYGEIQQAPWYKRQEEELKTRKPEVKKPDNDQYLAAVHRKIIEGYFPREIDYPPPPIKNLSDIFEPPAQSAIAQRRPAIKMPTREEISDFVDAQAMITQNSDEMVAIALLM